MLALVVLGVALATLLQRHGMFSAGVGVMLLLYGLLLAALAVLAVRGVTLVTGMVVAAGALHVMVAVSLALNGAPWLWAGVPLPLMTVVAGVWARVREQRELTRLS